MPHISKTNSKLGIIPSVNLPAGETCRPDAPCHKDCYAKRGHWKYKNVIQSLAENLAEYKRDPDYYFDDIANKTRFDRFFRWHSSGDIVDAAYFVGMCKVARKNKETKYLAFTKKFDIVNDYVDAGHRIPKNLTIVFSGWDADFKMQNPHNFPTTWVWFKNKINSHIPEGSMPCGGKCEECLACWQLRKGQSVFFKKH